MSQLRFRFVFLLIIFSLVAALISAQDQATSPLYGPYDAPLDADYRGFEGSYDYPSSPAPDWTGPLKEELITTENAGDYVIAIKEQITDSMVKLLSDPRKESVPEIWNAAAEGWYNEPWLSQIRDSIHGTYVGSQCFSPVLFPKSDLKAPFTTYVLVFYNDIAARSLARVWGDDAMSPNLTNEATQFDEGSIIVKAAFSTATAEDWEPMTDALSWDIYTNTYDCANNAQTSAAPSIFPVNFFQFDIIIKDSVAAPKTTWVFSTLTYDKNIEVDSDLSPAAQAWARMSVLGAMWGNDPDVTEPDGVLEENWINPDAPVYATETLGWGGRLSGPNDGAVQNPPYYVCKGDGCDPANPCAAADSCTFVDVGGPNLAMSSCMSCHGTAQYKMEAFLLPVPSAGVSPVGGPIPLMIGQPPNNYLVFFDTASEDWMKWFQDRAGTEPQNPDKGIMATDYDMNLPFKVLPQWAQEVCINQKNPHKDALCDLLNQVSTTGTTAVELDYQGDDVIPGG